jgi:hypothetical protein
MQIRNARCMVARALMRLLCSIDRETVFLELGLISAAVDDMSLAKFERNGLTDFDLHNVTTEIMNNYVKQAPINFFEQA